MTSSFSDRKAKSQGYRAGLKFRIDAESAASLFKVPTRSAADTLTLTTGSNSVPVGFSQHSSTTWLVFHGIAAVSRFGT